VVSFKLRAIYLQGKTSVPEAGWAPDPVWTLGEEKEFLALSEIEGHSCKCRVFIICILLFIIKGGSMWRDSMVYLKIGHRCFLLNPVKFIELRRVSFNYI
jgi:hypothetical protein